MKISANLIDDGQLVDLLVFQYEWLRLLHSRFRLLSHFDSVTMTSAFFPEKLCSFPLVKMNFWIKLEGNILGLASIGSLLS